MSLPHRKRRRPTIVCNVCKSRKVRCDRNLPCNSCVKHKLAHLCSYDDADTPPSTQSSGNTEPTFVTSLSVAPTSAPSFSLASLPTDGVYLAATTNVRVLGGFSTIQDVLGVNPLLHPSDRINFYLDYCSISFDPHTLEEINHGPFSWHLIVRVDPGLLHLWNFMLDIKPVAGLNKVPNVYSKTAQSHKERTQLQVLDRIRQHLVLKFDVANPRNGARDIPLGLTFNDPNRNNADVGLDDRLLGILPLKRVVWTHIDRFFRLLYPFFPYLDEDHFRTSVARILCPASYADERIATVHATGKMDHALLGILCIVLRMSYLALISNDQDHNTATMADADGDAGANAGHAQLLACPIGIETIDFARLCLNKYQVCNRSNLNVFQLIVFMRIYMEVSPEDPDGPARDMFQVNNGVLLQMAYAIGLNREPDKMTDTLINPRLNNVRRKLWTFVSFKDIVNALKFGLPFILLAFFSDCKFPFLTEANGNSADPSTDHYVAQSLAPLERLMPMMKDAVKNVLRVDEGTLVADLVAKINTLEVYVSQELGSMRECQKLFAASSENDVVPVLMVPYYIPIQVFLISVYFRLFLYYEHSNALLAFFYFKKIVTIIAQEVLPYVNDILDKPHPYFGFAAQAVINPHLEYFMHRSVGFLAAWVTRLGHQVVRSPQSPSDAGGLSQVRLKFLMRSLCRCCKVCLLGIHKMNHRYCYAWRIGTTFTYILRCLVSEGFYNNTKDPSYIPTIKYSDEQVSDLISVLEKLMLHVDLLHFSAYWSIVQEVTKSGREPSSIVLFNPLDSKIVFAGLPQNALDIGVGTGYSPAELPLDPSWFPAFNGGSDMNTVMGTFFEGPESYFDAFNNVASTQMMMETYGVN